MNYIELEKDFKKVEKFCLGKFEENSDLFKATVKDNIEKHRKGKKTLVLKDKDGNALSGVKVRATLKNHEFKHGAHIFMLDQFETEAENAEYRRTFFKYFNLATIPFYWAGIEPVKDKPRYSANSENVYRRPSPDLCLDYCREQGIDAKIHCLFYDKFIPGWVPKTDADAMKELYEKRFKEIADRYGNGVMYDIEVINELLETHWWTTHSVISDAKDSLEWSFKLAEKYFPNDVLVINDGNFIPEIGEKTYRHPYYMLIDATLSKGTRIDKIGIQNHIYLRMNDDDVNDYAHHYDPVKILKGLEVMSEFGKPLEITEVQIPTLGAGSEAEDLQAEVVKYLYTLWFSVENLESIIYWNSVNNTAYAAPEWNENNLRSGILNRDLSPRKSAQMLERLFKKEWHTDVELVSDENGKIVFDGYHGDYEICVHDEKESTYRVNFGKCAKDDKILCVD